MSQCLLVESKSEDLALDTGSGTIFSCGILELSLPIIHSNKKTFSTFLQQAVIHKKIYIQAHGWKITKQNKNMAKLNYTTLSILFTSQCNTSGSNMKSEQLLLTADS